MSAKFLEGASSKLAERWLTTILTPAFAFWSGGGIAILQRFGWAQLSANFSQQPESLQVGFLVGGFCVIAVSGFVIQRFELAVLRFLEGYWHPWLHPIRRRLIVKEKNRSLALAKRWQVLATFPYEQLTEKQRAELIQLDWQQMHRPASQDELMPTRLGNLLKSAECKSLEKYGLDAIICWPRLWLLLPDAVKKEIQSARADLNSATRFWMWSILFIFWTALGVWWAAPIGILAALFSYYFWALDAANIYGELVEATFDLYRHLLYQSLRWDLPADPEIERRVGMELTRYLWRGF